MTFVFGYGSLLAPADGQLRCRLRGYRRAWGVAMDNRRTIPGYKVYLDGAGDRPEVFVAFLDLVADAGASVGGIAFPVGPDELAALDARERNYARVDVTSLVDAAVGGPVFAYLGLPEARARLASARSAGTAVIARGYLEAVEAGAAAAGEVLDPPDLPVRDLTRVEVPANVNGAG
jgi:cation transport regulator ChaC